MIRAPLWLLAFIAGSSIAANVFVPGGSLTVSGTSTTGASFTFFGTLTQNDTIAFAQTGNPCLQSGGTGYCVNGAGVLTVAGTVTPTPVGGSTTFAGPAGIIPAGTWVYGSLLMQISGVGTVQVFPTNAANGSGSSTPPASLTLPTTTLSALGFGTFSQTNPTITFIVADTDFSDNGGQFSLVSAVPPPSASTPVPSLSEWGLIGLMLLLTGSACAALRSRTRPARTPPGTRRAPSSARR